jgi:hypothetical protein
MTARRLIAWLLLPADSSGCSCHQGRADRPRQEVEMTRRGLFWAAAWLFIILVCSVENVQL